MVQAVSYTHLDVYKRQSLTERSAAVMTCCLIRGHKLNPLTRTLIHSSLTLLSPLFPSTPCFLSCNFLLSFNYTTVVHTSWYNYTNLLLMSATKQWIISTIYVWLLEFPFPHKYALLSTLFVYLMLVLAPHSSHTNDTKLLLMASCSHLFGLWYCTYPASYATSYRMF